MIPPSFSFRFFLNYILIFMCHTDIFLFDKKARAVPENIQQTVEVIFQAVALYF